MLKITIPSSRLYNEDTNEFINVPETSLKLEHSLVSISKWESKFCKSFFYTKEKTKEELLEYIKCMTINDNVNADVYYGLTSSNIKDIKNYIDSPMTATTIRELSKAPSREIITSEILYYDMIAFGIPFECQKWHINRLITLIRVCNAKNGTQRKMSKAEQMAQYKALNASRRAALNSKG